MFEGIGRIGAYVAQQNLRFAAKYKIKTGQSLKDIKDQLREAMNESLRVSHPRKNPLADSTKVSIIRQKLRQGRKLSANELKYLKETDESLYDKAQKTEKAREELQQALKKAKSKDEARRAVMQAQMKVAAEAQLDSKGGGVNIGFNMGGSAASFDGPPVDNASEAVNSGEGNVNTPAAESAVDNGHAASTAPAAASSPAETSAESTTTPSDSSADKEALTDSAAKDKNAATPQPSSSSQFDGEIPGEKYLFMLAAIQDEWRRFIHTKDFDELPERDIDIYNQEEQPKKSHKPAYKKALDEDMAVLYRTQSQDLLPGDLLDLRAKL